MTQEHLQHLITMWGYPLMFVLMFFEGPIATIVAAFLASLGYFNIFSVFILSVSADVLGDMGLYALGYYGGYKFLAKLEKFLRISPAIVGKLKAKFHENSERIIFYVKSTTGLSYITFTLAGAVNMNFSKFVKNSFLGGLVWSFFLVLAGYFFGYAAGKMGDYIKYAGVAIFSAAVIVFIAIIFYKRRQTRKIVG